MHVCANANMHAWMDVCMYEYMHAYSVNWLFVLIVRSSQQVVWLLHGLPSEPEFVQWVVSKIFGVFIRVL